MNTTEAEIHNAIRDHLAFSCLKSFVPLNKWKNTLDIQQAILELWWRDDTNTQKRLFGYFETVRKQSDQFHKALNSIFLQMKRAQERRLTPDQDAQLADAKYYIGSQIEHNLRSDTLRLDLPVDSRDLDRAENRNLKAIIPTLHMERAVLERLVADFLWKDFFYCDLLPPANPEHLLPARNLRTKGQWMQAIYNNAADWGYQDRWPEVMKYKNVEDFYIDCKQTIEYLQAERLGSALPRLQEIAGQFRDKCEMAFQHDSELSLSSICVPVLKDENELNGVSSCAYDIFWHSVIEKPLSFFAQLPMNTASNANSIQQKRYADKPYMELLRGGETSEEEGNSTSNIEEKPNVDGRFYKQGNDIYWNQDKVIFTPQQKALFEVMTEKGCIWRSNENLVSTANERLWKNRPSDGNPIKTAFSGMKRALPQEIQDLSPEFIELESASERDWLQTKRRVNPQYASLIEALVNICE